MALRAGWTKRRGSRSRTRVRRICGHEAGVAQVLTADDAPYGVKRGRAPSPPIRRRPAGPGGSSDPSHLRGVVALEGLHLGAEAGASEDVEERPDGGKIEEMVGDDQLVRLGPDGDHVQPEC